MDFKQKLLNRQRQLTLNKLNLSSFEKIERDVDKHSLKVFGLGVGIGVVSFLFGRKYFLNKKLKELKELKEKEKSLLNDDSVDIKDYLKWKDDHKF